MHAEFLQVFVQRKTGRLSRDFEQYAAGLAEIDGMKISAIDHRRDFVAETDEMLAPLKVFGVVLRSKGNVMHRTGGDAAHCGVGLTKKVNDSAWRRIVSRGKAKPIPRFVNQTVAEDFCK